jgi:hypothetical protein
MKRFLFWFLVVLLAVGLFRSTSQRPKPVWRGSSSVFMHRDRGPDGRAIGARKVLEIDREGHRIVLIDDRGNVTSQPLPDDMFAPQSTRREVVEGLPVPVVPGTRVTEAYADTPKPPAPPQPPKPPRQHRTRVLPVPPRPPHPPAPPTPPVAPVVIKGQISATEQRAHDEARAQLVKKVSDWLEPDVPKTWRVPEPFIDGLVSEVKVSPIEKPTDPVYKDYGPMYVAEMQVDLSPPRRAEIAQAYQHEQTLKKLGVLGVILALVLVLLGTVSGYIRADEATKGYYTNRLRLAATLAAGAAGVAAYRWLA